LEAGQSVVANPRKFLSQVTFPDAPPPAAEEIAAVTPPPASESTPRRPAAPVAFDASAMASGFIRAADKDGDGRLSLEEYPAERRAGFAEQDANQDGSVDEGEMVAAMNKLAARFQAGAAAASAATPAGAPAGSGESPAPSGGATAEETPSAEGQAPASGDAEGAPAVKAADPPPPPPDVTAGSAQPSPAAQSPSATAQPQSAEAQPGS
jgi:hypothetical protein